MFSIAEVDTILVALNQYADNGGDKETIDGLNEKFNAWIVWTSMMGEEQ
jgi:hypothetical protein